jgi:hypothetical protein
MYVLLCVVLIATFGIGFWPLTCGVTSPGDIEIAHPAVAVREARALIVDRRRHPNKYGAFSEPASLPEALRIANLRYAKVHGDHVDLVIVRNPDWSAGARIWSERHRPHRDRPTKYPDVYFFRYTHELPESPDNIP